MNTRIWAIVSLLVMFAAIPQISAVQLTGRIVYGEKQPCPACSLSLLMQSATARTDDSGRFSIGTIAVREGMRQLRESVMFLHGDRLSFSTQSTQQLRIDRYDLSGRIVSRLFNKPLSGGRYAIDLRTAAAPAGFALIGVTMGEQTRFFKCFSGGTAAAGANGGTVDATAAVQAPELARTAAVDTLLISCKGYAHHKEPVTISNGDMGDISINSPNIIIILADDMGFGETGTLRRQFVKKNKTVYFETPELDKMAVNGRCFTDFYAGNTICAPSRCCLLTGKHPGHASIRANQCFVKGTTNWGATPALDPKVDTTFGQLLQKVRYKTALFGKWHLEFSHADISTHPESMGFGKVLREDWFVSDYNAVGYEDNYPCVLWNELMARVNFPSNLNSGRKYYLDDINTDSTLGFINKYKDSSFCIFVSYKTPHAPEDITDTSAFAAKPWPAVEKMHAARIQRIDRNIGLILRKLDTLGIAEHTLVLFTSDNGAHQEGGHSYTFFNSSGDFRGFKRDLYEGGIREPAIAYWKGMIAPGSVSNHPAAFWDMLPTFAEIAGVKSIPKNLDGISFLPALLNKTQSTHDYFYWLLHNPAAKQAVRMGNWKAVRVDPNATELYNLETDISETNNIAAANPAIVKTLDSIMLVARKASPLYPDPLPSAGPGQLQKVVIPKWNAHQDSLANE